MSDEPTLIIKRVKSRSSRVRDTSPPPDSAADSPAVTPDTLATKLKNKYKKSKPKSRLSFGSDDQASDGDVFKVKKSNLSRNLTLGSTPSTPGAAVPTNLDEASVSPRQTGPCYTKAYLNELKANTPSTPITRPPVDVNASYDASFDDSFDIDGALVENASELFGDTVIPSESVISAAKEKRGRLRDIATSEDFISLSVTKKEEGPKGPHPESRLMREEDELGEGEDDMAAYTGAQERIALGKKARKDEEQQRRKGMVEMIEDAEEDDEGTIEWEKAQVRRAVHMDDKKRQDVKPPKAMYKPTPIPAVIPVPTLASSTARLTNTLTTLTSSHASHTAELSSLAAEQAAIETKEIELRQMVENAERKRSWFTAFQDWIEGVASFLDEKFPKLEKLEDEHVSLLTERHDMIAKQRRTDDEDDIALFLGVPPPEPAPESEKTDELGRTIPSSNITPVLRATRRSARANRRLLRRVQYQSAHTAEDEGYSTDGSLLPGDEDDYRAALAKLAERQADVLSDVRAEEFREPQVGLARWFGEWREKYEDSYVGAWGGLGLVAAWEFWVRLEIVGWDPLEDESRGLDSFKWVTELHEYSRPQKETNIGTDAVPEIGPGGDMVSSMVSQITPRLCKIIEGGAFDPYSTKHIRRIIDVSEQVEAIIEPNGVRFQSLLKSVLFVFHAALKETQTLLAPSLGSTNPGAPFDPQSIPARHRFLNRRLKLLINVLKWRKYTGERFGVGELATALVRSCILPVAERGLEAGGEDALRAVVDKMPADLVPREVTMRLK